jgi:hypothetical protein
MPCPSKCPFQHTFFFVLGLTSCSIGASPNMVFLLVGPNEFKISCHKSLLGFFSKFFESALYDSSSEATRAEVHMLEESVSQIREFVAWLYTSQTALQLEIDALLESQVRDDRNFENVLAHADETFSESNGDTSDYDNLSSNETYPRMTC